MPSLMFKALTFLKTFVYTQTIPRSLLLCVRRIQDQAQTVMKRLLASLKSRVSLEVAWAGELAVSCSLFPAVLQEYRHLLSWDDHTQP